LNTYAYVKNNPVKFVDPLGLLNPGESACAVGPNPVCVGSVIVDIVSVLLGIWATIPDEDCDEDDCPPCKLIDGTIVPVGTIGHLPMHEPPPGQVEHGILGPHFNIFKANQAPRGTPKPCHCWWQRLGAVKPTDLPAGAIPIRPFAN